MIPDNIKEKSKPGVSAIELPKLDVESSNELDAKYLRTSLDLPELSEVEITRYFQALSRMNYGVDDGFYPLGSCTMKYNPRINEKIASLTGFNLHPLCGDDFSQGALQITYELSQDLSKITGMDESCLHLHAGAHGELTGLMLIKAYHKERKSGRKTILVPNSAHGTNPASVSLCGFNAKEVLSLKDGSVDIEDLKSKLNDDVAAIMLTIPNTVGIFEKDILTITKLVKDSGGLCYMDGANMNALLGIAKPGDMGIDVMHLNLHKTFSTPHGGGGPGAGAVCVKSILTPYLPVPKIKYKDNKYSLDYKSDKSIGKVTAFYGNFNILLRAYTYIKGLGKDGLKRVSEIAVLNANYAFSKLKKHFDAPINKKCMHEFIITDKDMPNHVTTLDIAKRLLDYGFHPPTIYFPLIIKGVMMIEPTETETKENIDMYIDTLIAIKNEADTYPETVKNAPHNTFVKRLDEVLAARKPCLNWKMENSISSGK